MVAPRSALLAVVISALSLVPSAAAQERGSKASAVGNPADAQTMPPKVNDGDDRRDLAVAKRVTRMPEFVQALRRGDANAAKRIFVAHGGSKDKVILVPTVGWNPTTGYNASEPFPTVPNNPVVCETYRWVPWYWNTATGRFEGYMLVCWGPGKDGHYGWALG